MSTDSNVYSANALALTDALQRVARLEKELSHTRKALKEKTQEFDKFKEGSKLFVKTSKQVFDDLKESSINEDFVNKEYHDAVIKFQKYDSVKLYDSNRISITLGHKNGQPYGAIFCPLKGELAIPGMLYGVAPTFAGECLHLDAFPCIKAGGLKVANIDGVYERISYLEEFLAVYLTDEKVAELAKERDNAKDEIMDLLSKLLGQNGDKVEVKNVPSGFEVTVDMTSDKKEEK